MTNDAHGRKPIKKLQEGDLLKDFDDKVRIVDIESRSTATKRLCWILDALEGLFGVQIRSAVPYSFEISSPQAPQSNQSKIQT